MKQATDAQILAVKDLVIKGPEYCRTHRGECNDAIRTGFAQGLNECPNWEGYRAIILGYLAGV